MTSYCVNLTAINSVELFFIVHSKNPPKKNFMKTEAVTYFQAKNPLFLEKRCFPPVYLISHCATCMDLGEIMMYVCNATVASLSFKKTGDQTLGGI